MEENKRSEGLLDKIKQSLGMSIKQLTLDRELEGENASASYLMSKYGTVLTDEDRKKAFIRSTNTAIQYKTAMHEFHCTSQIPTELVKYKDEFIKMYTDKGYVCMNLVVAANLNSGYNVLFISWYGCY